MPFTDKQIEAALRAWWGLRAGEPMPWSGVGSDSTFRATSFRDMRAALEAVWALRRPLPKRPVAFLVANGTGKFVVTQDEQEAADIAEIVGVDYDGLYVRKDETASAHSPDDPTDASPSAPVGLNQT